MTDKKKVIVESTIPHPMETVFDIESNTTVITREKTQTELVEIEMYDEKDKEVEDQFQEVYDLAIDAFEVASETIETVESKYRARNEEVAVQYLNAALNAAKEKSSLKQHKDNLLVKQNKTGPKTVNQTLIVADRNELLKSLQGFEEDPE